MGYSNPSRPAVNLSQWPLPNVWLGVSVEDQAAADERIPLLLQCPAAVRWISAEPLLGPINFRWTPYAHQAAGETYREYLDRTGAVNEYEALRLLDWVVAGGESGTGARPMHPEWARMLRDQCAAAGVSFLFKQWGAWASVSEVEGDGPHHQFDDGATVRRLGKKAAGRLLDGVQHDGYPQ
jgi:protein gp37